MDEQVPQSQQSPHIASRPKKGLLGVFFIVIFVIITIALFLGILNYLNILPVSDLWPQQFGWLPHKQSKQYSNVTIVPPVRQSYPTFAPSSVTFAYDASKADTLLSKYLRDKIKSDYLPSKIEVKHKLIASGKQEGTDYEFGANWTINNIFFQSNFHYEISTNNPSDMQFSIQPQNIKETTSSASLTKTLSATYLKNIPESSNFNCGVSQTTISFCENFQETALGKEGFGLVIAKAQPNNTIFIFSCFIPKESVYFNIRTSCLLFNEKGR